MRHIPQALVPSDAGGRGRPGNAYDASHTAYFEGQQVTQQQLMREQDQHLESLEGTVARLGEIAVNINTELDEQAQYVMLAYGRKRGRFAYLLQSSEHARAAICTNSTGSLMTSTRM